VKTRGGEWLFGAIAGVLVLGFAAVFSSAGRGLHAAEKPIAVPVPALDNPLAPGALQTAVLAGGCFWGTQGVFEHVIGVHKVLAGYAGGSKSTAHYDTVSTGTTGHAESIEVQFDPAKISYGEILRVFFSVAHDPTQLNRQGPRRGDAVPLVDILRGSDTAENCSRLHSSVTTGPRLQPPDRHAGRSVAWLLSGRGLPPGLPVSQPARALHRLQRSAEDRESQAGVARYVP
jgi:hypothetical protein